MAENDFNDVQQWIMYGTTGVHDNTETLDTKPSKLAELYYNASMLRIYGEALIGFASSISGDIDADTRTDLNITGNVPGMAVMAPEFKPLSYAITNKDKIIEIVKKISESATIVSDILGKVKNV